MESAIILPAFLPLTKLSLSAVALECEINALAGLLKCALTIADLSSRAGSSTFPPVQCVPWPALPV